MWQLPNLSADNILMYLRKSRTDDPALTVDEVLSKHEQMLDDWVSRNLPGDRIPEANRYREVVSGETIESRPRVQELLRRIESPRVKAVLIVEPQRLSRGDLEDIGRLVKLLRYSNTIVITLQYSYDLRDERDRDMFERELKRGNEFLEYQKRIMNNGRLLSVQNGNFIGQKPPYGYRKVVIKEGKRKCHTLEPDPERAPIVKMVFEMYASGTSAHQIAQTLCSMGIPTADGGRWTAASIKPMLSNDHYIGMVHWNRRKTVKVVEDGEVIATRPRSSDYLSYPGKHPAIIDKDLWDAVQSVRGTHPPIKDKAKYANPFAGLVYCQCGARMSRRQYKSQGIERCQPRLLCENQVQCGTASCTLSEFTEAVIASMEQEIADFDLKLENASDDSAVLQEQLIARLEKRLEELDRLELAQWDKYTQEAMPKHIFEQLNQKVTQEKATVLLELKTAKETVPPKVDYTQKRETFAAAVKTLQNPNASVKEQNQLLKQCIDRITYSRSKKDSTNRRFGTPEPIELDIHFKV
ncbi:MAG: recombinase family protein [Candidatus Faecousia sp.]|nr:recombinase family protein [Candidatus Faecousia sp.]